MPNTSLFSRPFALAAAALAASFSLLGQAQAAEPASCKAVRFADVGWTDITATTAVMSEILKGIGYKPSAQVLSVPVTYSSLKAKRLMCFWAIGCRPWKPTSSPTRPMARSKPWAPT